MNWQPIESKMFTAAAHDAEKRMLYLRFRSTGDVYRYSEFPAADEYEQFLRAESRGRYFLAHIRDHYRYEKLANLRAA
jgi:hypothetical protein